MVAAKSNGTGIAAALVGITREVEALGKDRKNASQGFSYRGIDDVYNSLHNLLAAYGVITLPEVLEERHEERTTKSGSAMIYRVLKMRYTFVAEDGSQLACTVMGEGMDSGDKAANKAMSVAHKYCLLQVFCVPTCDGSADPDAETPAPTVRKTATTSPAAKATPSAAKPAPAPVVSPAPAKSPAPKQENGCEVLEAVVEKVWPATEKMGKKGPFKIYAAKIGGLRMSTFSDSIGEKLSELEGCNVEVKYTSTVSGQYTNHTIQAIERIYLRDEPTPQELPEPAEASADDDNIPF